MDIKLKKTIFKRTNFLKDLFTSTEIVKEFMNREILTLMHISR